MASHLMLSGDLKLLIRMATLEDTEAVAKLGRDLSLYHASYHPLYRVKENVSDLTRAYIQDRIAKSLAGNGLILVAQDKEVVGYLSCNITERNDPNWAIQQTGHIGALYVLPKYRRKGVASALMNEALKWLKERRIEYVELNVDCQNAEAAAVYRALGFEQHQVNLVKKM